MKKSHSENTVGPWAKEKLDALEKYLKYYCSVLKNQGFTLVYVDGFAGAPVTTIRQPSTRAQVSELWSEAGIDDFKDIDEFVLGSPIRSLNINPGFDRHYFFDLDDRRVAELETLKPSWPDKWVHIETGDANKRIRKLISKIGHRREVRGVAFLDPYGPNLEWQTVVDLAASKNGGLPNFDLRVGAKSETRRHPKIRLLQTFVSRSAKIRVALQASCWFASAVAPASFASQASIMCAQITGAFCDATSSLSVCSEIQMNSRGSTRAYRRGTRFLIWRVDSRRVNFIAASPCWCKGGA